LQLKFSVNPRCGVCIDSIFYTLILCLDCRSHVEEGDVFASGTDAQNISIAVLNNMNDVTTDTALRSINLTL